MNGLNKLCIWSVNPHNGRRITDHQQPTIISHWKISWPIIISAQPFDDGVFLICFSCMPNLPNAAPFKGRDIETIFFLTGYNVPGIVNLFYFDFLLVKTIWISILNNSNHISIRNRSIEDVDFIPQFSHSKYIFLFTYLNSLSEIDGNWTRY